MSKKKGKPDAPAPRRAKSLDELAADVRRVDDLAADVQRFAGLAPKVDRSLATQLAAVKSEAAALAAGSMFNHIAERGSLATAAAAVRDLTALQDAARQLDGERAIQASALTREFSGVAEAARAMIAQNDGIRRMVEGWAATQPRISRDALLGPSLGASMQAAIANLSKLDAASSIGAIARGADTPTGQALRGMLHSIATAPRFDQRAIAALADVLEDEAESQPMADAPMPGPPMPDLDGTAADDAAAPRRESAAVVEPPSGAEAGSREDSWFVAIVLALIIVQALPAKYATPLAFVPLALNIWTCLLQRASNNASAQDTTTTHELLREISRKLDK